MLATGNAGKVRELADAFPGVDVALAPAGFDPDETGDTLYQNALIKAEALRAMTDGAVGILADDSGLFVHALDGRPGVFSARYAGPGATYSDNCSLLLKELAGHPDRSAGFVCVLVALLPDGRRLVAEGNCPGQITEAPRILAVRWAVLLPLILAAMRESGKQAGPLAQDGGDRP